MSSIYIAGVRKPRSKCRVCQHVFYDTDTMRSEIAHLEEHGEELAAKRAGDRAHLDFLKPQDPELEAWMRREYAQGRLKPSTKPV